MSADTDEYLNEQSSRNHCGVAECFPDKSNWPWNALCRNIPLTALVDNRFESDDCDIEDSNHNSLIEVVWSCDGTMILF